jgi:DNA-3-methyladenine glycosylase II
LGVGAKRKIGMAKPKIAGKRAAKKRKAAKAPAAPMQYAPGRLIVCEDSLGEAVAALHALDVETIGRLVEIGGPPPLRRRAPGFAGLAAIIVSQQVSVASANAIFGRLESQLAPLSHQTLLAAEEATLRGCGLSAPKIRALTALAQAVAGGLDLEALAALPAPDAHSALTAVKGVGPWTADIFLLFCVGHPDAFPGGDLALQEAAKLALALKQRPTQRELERIAERWRPYRGVAARMLWAYYKVAKQRAGVIDLGAKPAAGVDESKPEAKRAHDRQTDRTAPGSQKRPRQAARGAAARLRSRRK